MFTGDRSGEWLFRALHETGFADRPDSTHRDDGLQLRDAWISAIVRCAPPDNKPDPAERDRCLPWLAQELGLLPHVRVLVALGGFAWAGALALLRARGHLLRPRPTFAHGARVEIEATTLLGCYHPSQQNTFTGRLTRPMLRAVFELARARLDTLA
jgi:uracil-DNA glycosylase family 4